LDNGIFKNAKSKVCWGWKNNQFHVVCLCEHEKVIIMNFYQECFVEDRDIINILFLSNYKHTKQLFGHSLGLRQKSKQPIISSEMSQIMELK
jgi:hypothetical protein